MADMYYWEDFTVGLTMELGQYQVTEEEILEFARRYDPQPFHTDHAAAARSIYGGLIASGWHTCAIAMRLMCDGYMLRSKSLGSPGVDTIRWTRPVRPGDVLSARLTVLESRASTSKPDRGVVKTRWELFNQNGETVMIMEGYGMFARRNRGAPGTPSPAPRTDGATPAADQPAGG